MIDINLALLGLFLSIVYSSSEIALLSASSLQVDVWEKQGKRLSKWASSILDQKSEYLAVILIGTNLANILTTSFATVFFIRIDIIPNEMIIIPIAIIILLIGEILPKTIIRDHSNIGLMILAPFLKISFLIFSPMILIIRKTGWINISENIRSSKQELEEKRDDIQHAYEQVDDPKAMEQEQKEMISNVFDFRESTAYEAMTPRTEISAVSNTDSLEKVLHVFIDSGHSKLPVYENDLDNIIGIIYLYDLFHAPKNIADVIKPVLHVPYSKPTMDLMLEFQSAHHALAIVLDEHGGSAGIITAEDLFEELFGEFEDEFDENTEKGSKLNDGSILVNARMDWKEFNSKFNKIIPEGEYETIGGYIISELGRIPNKGEHLFMSIGQIIIQEATARQIHQVKIYPKEINSSE
tara:strand:- start:459 stop:1688 length:1230 start_codon:yes stop_codon:yes gene_type:complete